MFFAFAISALAGLSTLLGGVVGMFYRKGNHKWLSIGLGLSAGVMIYISFVELFAIGQQVLIERYGVRAGGFNTLLSFFVGIVIVICIDRMLPDFHGPDVKRKSSDECYKQKNLWRTGLLTALVIGIHNLPEGIITFLQTLENPKVGVLLAVAIAIHNIPEGMAVYIPVYEATHSRSKAMWMCFLSGITEPLGALLAYKLLAPFLQHHHLQYINIAIAGVMVYISLDELLPTAREYGHYHLAMLGLCAGMLIMGLSLVLMS